VFHSVSNASRVEHGPHYFRRIARAPDNIRVI
jgi:hypothetical protein